jgi:MarR family 2-MHQ and catechol resistance regulon transcriptional repressor
MWNHFTSKDRADVGTKYQGPENEMRALDAYIALVRASESVMAPLARGLNEEKLTLSQFGVLEALLHIGPLSPCEIARKLLKSGGNITLVVDNLERRGFVHRRRHVDDRRYLTVDLTREGRRFIEQIFPGHAREIASRMHALSPAELDTLRALCKKLGHAQSADAEPVRSRSNRSTATRRPRT